MIQKDFQFAVLKRLKVISDRLSSLEEVVVRSLKPEVEVVEVEREKGKREEIEYTHKDIRTEEERENANKKIEEIKKNLKTLFNKIN